MFKSLPYVTFSTGVIAAAMTLAAGWLPELMFNKAEALWHAPWQLVTGHLVHSDAAHLGWNVLALFVVGAMLEGRSRALLLVSLISGLIAVNAFLLSEFSPIQFYVGLSGVLNTLFFVLLWKMRRESPWLVAVIAVAGLAKIVAEIVLGQSLVTEISWPPYAPAHGAGFIGAVLVVYLNLARRAPQVILGLPKATYDSVSSLRAARNPAGCQSWRKEISKLEPWVSSS